MSQSLPAYADLPVIDGAPPGSSWGLWGPDDRFGSLNLLTPERALAGSAEVRKGAVFPLNLELELPSPPFGDRGVVEHRVIELLGGLGNDDEFVHLNPQAGTQWDGFGHVQHPGYGFYNGLPREDHGMHHWARRGIACRGVVIDVERWRAEQGRPLAHGTTDHIQPEELLAAIEAQGAGVEPGDLMLIYTGFLSWYRGLSPEERVTIAENPPMPGLTRGARMAATLWDLHPSAIVSDNMAIEAWPPERPLGELAEIAETPDIAVDMFLHTSLIPLLGIPLGELWDLAALAADCAEDGVYSCMVTSAPMNQQGGISSMGNALALK